MKNNINGYNINEKLQSFFELYIGNNLTLSIYDSDEGYEIEVIEGIDEENEYIDTMIYLTDKWENLKTLLDYTMNNLYSDKIRELLKKEIY